MAIVALFIFFESHTLSYWDGAEMLSLFLLLAWFSIPTLIGAHSLWMLFHRSGHRPGIGGYVLLAVLVVLASHTFGLTVPALLVAPLDGGSMLSMSFLLLRLHVWLTVSMVVVATGLFAWWAQRRWPTGLPSGL